MTCGDGRTKFDLRTVFLGSLSFDNSLNATNYVTLGTVGVGDDEYVGVRIEADTSWSGYIDSITVSFGAGTGTISAVPDLDDIDCNDDGTDCNLSFGASKAISGYTSVAGNAGLGAAIDVNGLYQTAASSNNLRVIGYMVLKKYELEDKTKVGHICQIVCHDNYIKDSVNFANNYFFNLSTKKLTMWRINDESLFFNDLGFKKIILKNKKFIYKGKKPCNKSSWNLSMSYSDIY